MSLLQKIHAFLLLSLATVSIFAITNANAALVSIGNGLVNDTDHNITWTQDANLFQTQAATAALVGNLDGFVKSVMGDQLDLYQYVNPSKGSMDAADALLWVNYLNNIGYQGYNNWRLPTGTRYSEYPRDPNIIQSDSELGHLFYKELGGQRGQPIVTTHNANYDLFNNIAAPSIYWNAPIDPPGGYAFLLFSFNSGFQSDSSYGAGPESKANVWLVRDGNVDPLPVPGTIWLFGSSLIGIIAFSRKKTIQCATWLQKITQ
jgi:hypothetical protein